MRAKPSSVLVRSVALGLLAALAGAGCGDDGDAFQGDAIRTDGDAQGDATGDAQGDATGDAQGDATGDAQGDGTGDAQGDATGDATPDTTVTVPVEATSFAALTGVASFELTLVPGATPDAPPALMIALRDLGGFELGVIDVALEPTGLTASIASPVGPIVYRAGAALEGDRLFVSNSVSVAGQELRLDITSTLDAGGVPSEESAILRAPGSPDDVPGGGNWSGPESGIVALTLASPDQSPSHELIAAWIGDVVPAALLSSPDLLRLIAAMLDPALGSAIAQAIDRYAPQSPNALHLSPTCTSFRDRVHRGVGNDACRSCASLDPTPRGPLPSPRPSLGTLWALLPACRTCLVGAAAITPDLINCAYAFFLSERHFTDAYCQTAAPAAPPGMRRRASADAHSCQTIPVCDEALCVSACEARGVREGLDVHPECAPDGRLCDCGIDWDAFCRARHGAANCGPARLMNGVARCDVAACDDGAFAETCPENPGSAERCDTLDPSSCASGYCAPGCTGCIGCECGVQGAACAGDEVCDGCQCVPRRSCAEDGPGAPGWCDPAASAAWCGERACDAETCRCVQAQCTPGCAPGACNIVDDCGALCECPGSEVCNASNRCVACVPDCDRGERGACGPSEDGCGGPCACQGGDRCDAETRLCECVPACAAGRCGDDMDGCGGACACQGAGEGCDLETGMCVVTPPPTGLVATAGTGEVTLTWPAFAGATSYNAYVGFAPGVTIANGSKIAGATSPSVIKGVAPGLPVYAVLTAVTGSRESAPSTEVNATPSAARDTTAPTVLYTAPVADQIGIEPSAPIRVGVSEPLDPATLAAGITVTGPAGAVAGARSQVGLGVRFVPSAPLTSATRYTVNVTTALKDALGNPLTAARSFSFTTRPAAPGNLAVLEGHYAATLSWAPVEGATGYAIHRSVSAGGPYTQFAGTVRTSYTDVNVYADVYYRVSAFTAAGESARSNEVHARPTAEPLLTPGTARVRAGNGEALVSWDSSGTGSIYTVLRASSPTGGFTVVRDDLTGVTFRDSGLVNGTRYHYVIHARNGAQRSAWSAEADVLPQAELPPAPTGLTATPGASGVALAWAAVPNAGSYIVYATLDYPGSDGDGLEQRPAVLAGASTNSLLLPLGEGVTYRFSVAAINRDNLTGAPSAEVSAAPVGFPAPSGDLPPAPSNLAAQPGQECVTLSWDQVPSALWYYVYRAEAAGPNDTYIGYTSAFDNRFTECGLARNTPYSYVLRTQDRSNIFSANSAVIATATADTRAGQTTLLTSEAGQGQVALGWTPATGATRFHVHRRGEHSGWQELATTTALGWVDASASDESSYYYAVESDNGTQRGVFSAVTSELVPRGTYPAAPVPRLGAVPGDSCTTITWDVVPGSIWYYLYRAGAPAGPYAGNYLAYTGNVYNNRYTDCGLKNDVVFTAAAASDTLTFAEEHGFAVNDPLVLSGSALAAPLTAGVTYYVKSVPSPNSVTLAQTPWGPRIDLTSNGSGTQKAQQTYYYVLKSQDGSNVFSPQSAELSVRPSATRPGVALLGGSYAGRGQVALDWSAAPGATRYHVHRRTEDSPWEELTTSTTSGLGFVDRTVVDGVAYSYSIESDDGNNRGIFSAPSVSLTPDATLPEPPSTHLVAEPGNGCVTVTFDLVPDAVWFYLYRAQPGGGPYDANYAAYIDGSDNRLTACELDNGTPYHYVLRTQHIDNRFSGFSVELSATPSAGLPGRVERLFVSPGAAKTLTLSWTPDDSVLGYRISRRTDTTPWTTIAQTTGASFTDPGRTSGATYHYAVQAISLAGAGAPSVSASATAP